MHSHHHLVALSTESHYAAYSTCPFAILLLCYDFCPFTLLPAFLQSQLEVKSEEVEWSVEWWRVKRWRTDKRLTSWSSRIVGARHSTLCKKLEKLYKLCKKLEKPTTLQ